MRGFLIIVLAVAARCFSSPDSFRGSLPHERRPLTREAYPSGKSKIFS